LTGHEHAATAEQLLDGVEAGSHSNSGLLPYQIKNSLLVLAFPRGPVEGGRSQDAQGFDPPGGAVPIDQLQILAAIIDKLDDGFPVHGGKCPEFLEKLAGNHASRRWRFARGADLKRGLEIEEHGHAVQSRLPGCAIREVVDHGQSGQNRPASRRWRFARGADLKRGLEIEEHGHAVQSRLPGCAIREVVDHGQSGQNRPS